MIQHKLSDNLIMGVVAVLLGIVSMVESVRLYPLRSSPLVGDHSFPCLVGIILVILGLLLIFLVKSKPVKVEYPEKAILMKMIYSMITMVGYGICIQVLGYLISTFLALIGLFRVFGSYQWKKCGILSLVATIAIYLVFVMWLGMPFPTGIFEF